MRQKQTLDKTKKWFCTAFLCYTSIFAGCWICRYVTGKSYLFTGGHGLDDGGHSLFLYLGCEGEGIGIRII